MANIEIRFKDQYAENDFITCSKYDNFIVITSKYGEFDDNERIIELDKSTAIRFAKELRKQINLLPKEEVGNE